MSRLTDTQRPFSHLARTRQFRDNFIDFMKENYSRSVPMANPDAAA
ncbi:MAG: hypothetical protein V7698_08740 [Paracoccaceae bacterium]|nr:hypothetical protein [Paracoccaceae bacterium]